MKTTDIELRIIQGANDLFFRHGVRSVTMDDIAGHLGVSKKTIYIYYRDKDELVHSLTRQQLHNQICDMNECRKVSADAIDEILRVMKHMAGYFSRINPALFYDLQKYHQQAWKQFKDFKEKEITGFVEENLRQGIEQELYRKDLKIKILAKLRVQQIDMGFNPDVFPPGEFHIPVVQLALLDHFLHGIVTLKGYKMINKYKEINEEE